MPELVDLAALQRQRALLRHRALGDDDDRVVRALVVPVLDAGAHLVDVERLLGHQDHVGAAGEARVRGDPPGVAAHHLDHHHPVVTLGGGVQPVDGVGGDLHRGVEPEREVGGRQVVVDRLGHTDDLHAFATEAGRDTEGVLAADGDEGVDALAGQRVEHAPDAVVGLVGDWCATCRGWCRRGGQRAHRRHRELHRLVLDHTSPSVAEADDLVAVHALALADDGPDDRIQARGSRPRR